MKVLRLSAVLAFALLAGHAAFAWDHSYQQGRLVDATTQDREKKGNTSSRAIFTVEAAGMVYTVRGEKVGSDPKNYTKGMIVGDPVQVAVEGDHLYLRTPTGKELKTDILKRARSGATGSN